MNSDFIQHGLMESLTAKLEAKLTQLRLARDKTDTVITKNNRETIKRHQQTLKTLIDETDGSRLELETLNLVNKEDAESTRDWNSKIEDEIGKADQCLVAVQTWIEDNTRENDRKRRQEELDHERELFETRLKYQTELDRSKGENAKPNVAATFGPSSESKSTSDVHVKLPKLVITKFNGTFQDWPRFWNQFSETIDKTGVPNVTKFAYLRELLDTKVKSCVEALPFTNEGYNRAKSILQAKYGKESEIVKAYTKQILELPTITEVNVKKMHEFSEKLSYCVQSLETMGKLQQVNGNVAMTLDKLSAIRGDLVRTDPEWENWDYIKLSEALVLWTRRNPLSDAISKDPPPRREKKLFQSNVKPRGCVYCGDTTHKSINCGNVTNVGERKQILARQRRCFNCTGEGHRATNCTSKLSCQNCERRHHTSVCDQENREKLTLKTASKGSEGIFPVVIVKVKGITCRALVDSGAGSS